jgi:hypothetical protein
MARSAPPHTSGRLTSPASSSTHQRRLPISILMAAMFLSFLVAVEKKDSTSPNDLIVLLKNSQPKDIAAPVSSIETNLSFAVVKMGTALAIGRSPPSSIIENKEVKTDRNCQSSSRSTQLVGGAPNNNDDFLSLPIRNAHTRQNMAPIVVPGAPRGGSRRKCHCGRLCRHQPS